MESVAYEMIKNEGIQQGLQQGLQQGMIRDAQEMILECVVERFGRVPPELEKTILAIPCRVTLKYLFKGLFRVTNLEEFEAQVARAAGG